MNHSTEGSREFADFGAYLVLTGLGSFVLRDSYAGMFLCTIPNAHPNFLHDFRVCGCEDCHNRRINVYGGLFAWSVTPEARECARLSCEEEW